MKRTKQYATPDGKAPKPMTITTQDEAAVLYDCCIRVIALASMYSDEAVAEVVERIASQVRGSRDQDESLALTFIMEAVKLVSKE